MVEALSARKKKYQMKVLEDLLNGAKMESIYCYIKYSTLKVNNQ